jgi:hypothetical protein
MKELPHKATPLRLAVARAYRLSGGSSFKRISSIRLPPPRFALRRASPKRSEGGKPDPTWFCEFCGFCVECRHRWLSDMFLAAHAALSGLTAVPMQR